MRESKLFQIQIEPRKYPIRQIDRILRRYYINLLRTYPYWIKVGGSILIVFKWIRESMSGITQERLIIFCINNLTCDFHKSESRNPYGFFLKKKQHCTRMNKWTKSQQQCNKAYWILYSILKSLSFFVLWDKSSQMFSLVQITKRLWKKKLLTHLSIRDCWRNLQIHLKLNYLLIMDFQQVLIKKLDSIYNPPPPHPCPPFARLENLSCLMIKKNLGLHKITKLAP